MRRGVVSNGSQPRRRELILSLLDSRSFCLAIPLLTKSKVVEGNRAHLRIPTTGSVHLASWSGLRLMHVERLRTVYISASRPDTSRRQLRAGPGHRWQASDTGYRCHFQSSAVSLSRATPSSTVSRSLSQARDVQTKRSSLVLHALRLTNSAHIAEPACLCRERQASW